MAGFPVRINRDSLGPPLANRRRVYDRTKEIGADVFGLAWWTIAGAAIAGDLAWAVVEDDGTLLAAGEAFDPRGAYLPASLRLGVGVFTLTYAASYPDEEGVAQALTIWGGHATPQSLLDLRAVVSVAGPVVTVSIFDDTGAPADARFLVSVK